jgi:VanZ family protein
LIRRNQRGIATALVCANLLFIWGNSLLPASVSAAFSRWVKELLGIMLGGIGAGAPGEGPLRKMAHFLEFASLGLLLGWRISLSRPKFWILPTLLLGASAACVDEMLQHFSPGRAPRFADVGIDTAGILLGIALLALGKYIRNQKTIQLEDN